MWIANFGGDGSEEKYILILSRILLYPALNYDHERKDAKQFLLIIFHLTIVFGMHWFEIRSCHRKECVTMSSLYLMRFLCRLCLRKKDGCNSASGLSVNWAAVLLLALATGGASSLNQSGISHFRFRLSLPVPASWFNSICVLEYGHVRSFLSSFVSPSSFSFPVSFLLSFYHVL